MLPPLAFCLKSQQVELSSKSGLASFYQLKKQRSKLI